MLLGGMPQLLTRLEKNFQFTEPRAATLETTPVTVIEGYWKPQALLALRARSKGSDRRWQTDRARELSGQLPTQIRLIVRTEDSFPLRIEYLRSGKAVGDAPPPVTTIMAMEFYDIRAGVHIDPLTFTYNPGNQEVADHTEVYLTSLGLNRPATRRGKRNRHGNVEQLSSTVPAHRKTSPQQSLFTKAPLTIPTPFTGHPAQRSQWPTISTMVAVRVILPTLCVCTLVSCRAATIEPMQANGQLERSVGRSVSIAGLARNTKSGADRRRE